MTSQGKELSSEIDPVFGQAKWLLAGATETGKSEVHDNSVSLLSYAAAFFFLFLAVWVPCCVSDIVFPLLFKRKPNLLLNSV